MKLSFNITGEEDFVALYDDANQLVDSQRFVDQKNQTDNLLPAIDDLLCRNKLTKKDIREIYINSLAKSYTATRVGVVTASILGLIFSLPVYYLETIDKIAPVDLSESITKRELSPVPRVKYLHQPKITLPKTLI
jgi:tRNA A37 threonylcarbamoyladenosine modification protein TsaB